MCRIAGFIGPPFTLGELLCDPPHGLAHQSWAAQEMVSATVNADGWGAAWFDPSRRPAAYRQILPIWADVNLDALARSLHSDVWLANVRSATAGLGTDYANTQPFHNSDENDPLLFTHNGFIDHFAHTLRARMRAALDPEIEITINGNTDSEYLFALIRQQSGTLVERVRAAVTLIHEWLADAPDVRALLNVIVSDGRRVVAIRDALHADAPSLYCHPDWHDGVAIGSEAFDDHPDWSTLNPGELVVVESGTAPLREWL